MHSLISLTGDYKMSNYEILKAMHLIHKMKSSGKRTSLKSNIKTISQFSESDNFDLPLTVSGRLITCGEYKDAGLGTIRVTKDELLKTFDLWKEVEIYKDHSCFERLAKGLDVSADSVIGSIKNVEWVEDDGGAINWFGEIVDRDIAYKIIKGLIKHVSIGFTADDILNEEGVYDKKNIEPQEMSLIIKNPRDKKASIVPSGVKYSQK
jgi:hypothetical protein